MLICGRWGPSGALSLIVPSPWNSGPGSEWTPVADGDSEGAWPAGSGFTVEGALESAPKEGPAAAAPSTCVARRPSAAGLVTSAGVGKPAGPLASGVGLADAEFPSGITGPAAAGLVPGDGAKSLSGNRGGSADDCAEAGAFLSPAPFVFLPPVPECVSFLPCAPLGA